MTILKTVAILGIAGVIGAVALNAEPTNQERGFFQEKRAMMQHFKAKHQKMRAIFNQLDLSDEQETALKANRQEMRKTMKAQRGKLKLARDMSQFVTVDGVDREGLTEQAQVNVKTMVGLRADMMEKTLAILTGEQRVKFVELLKAEK